jgi:beta-glucosidase
MNEPESVFWSHYIDEKTHHYTLLVTVWVILNLNIQTCNYHSFAKSGKIEVSVTIKKYRKCCGKRGSTIVY